MENLFKLTARDAVSNLKKGEISPMELIDAAEERIRKTDDKINALPTLCFDRARKNARHILEHPKKDIHHPEIVDWALLNTKKEQEAYLEILIDRLGAFTKRVF